MGLHNKNDDSRIFAAIGCLFAGFLFIWNITANISDIYELRLDTETCSRVRTLGLVPSAADCVFTVPFRQAGAGIPVGFLTLPDGSEIQVSPLAASRTNRSAEWSNPMKAQFLMALLFWVASLVLLFSAFRDRE